MGPFSFGIVESVRKKAETMAMYPIEGKRHLALVGQSEADALAALERVRHFAKAIDPSKTAHVEAVIHFAGDLGLVRRRDASYVRDGHTHFAFAYRPVGWGEQFDGSEVTLGEDAPSTLLGHVVVEGVPTTWDPEAYDDIPMAEPDPKAPVPGFVLETLGVIRNLDTVETRRWIKPVGELEGSLPLMTAPHNPMMLGLLEPS